MSTRYLLAILFPLTAFAQVNISGQVALCDGFESGISVKGKLTYKRIKKKKTFVRLLDTLKLDIQVSSIQEDILTTQTDASGRFTVDVPGRNVYRFRFTLAGPIFRDTVLTVLDEPVQFTICIADSGFHNLYFRKIPFDSLMAKSDLAKGNVRLLTLVGDYGPTGTPILSLLTKEDIEKIEAQFRFIFDTKYIPNVQHTYLSQREREYNEVVYRHLNKLCMCDSREAIRDQVRNALRARKRSKSQ